MPAIDGSLLKQEIGNPVPVPAKRKIGRPSTYNAEIANEICRRIATGRSTQSVCLDPDMPDDGVVYRWRMQHADFSEMLARARDERSEAYHAKIVELSERVITDDSLEYQRANVAIQGYERAAKLMQNRQPVQRVSLENPDGSPLLGDTRELAKALLAGLAGAGVTQIEGVLATYHEIPSETPGFVVPAPTLPQDGDLPSDA